MKSEGVSNKLLEFDALRALSILLLFLVHCEVFSRKFNGVSIEPIGPYVGALMLGSFFFIAGYFSDGAYFKRNNILAYIKSKFIRIYPPYLLALLSFSYIMGYSLKKRDWLVYASNLQFIFSPNFAKQLLTLWYISLLVGFYAIHALLFVRIKSNKILFLSAALIFCAAYLTHIKTGLFDARLFEYLFIFTAGIFFSRDKKAFDWFFTIPFALLLAFAAIGLFLYGYVQYALYNFISWQHLLAVNIYILGWVLFLLRVFRGRVSEWKIWAPISTASFFAYLYHRPIWEIVAKFNWGILSRDVVWVRLLPGSVITLVVCYFLQLGYDALTRRLKAGLLRRENSVSQ